MHVPPFIGAAWNSVRAAYRQLEFRRQAELTVLHEKGRVVSRTGSSFSGTTTYREDFYIVKLTNNSPTRQLVVRRVWFATSPPISVVEKEFRIDPDGSWTKDVRASSVPGELDQVLKLGRCELGPDDKVIESRSGGPTTKPRAP